MKKRRKNKSESENGKKQREIKKRKLDKNREKSENNRLKRGERK